MGIPDSQNLIYSPGGETQNLQRVVIQQRGVPKNIKNRDESGGRQNDGQFHTLDNKFFPQSKIHGVQKIAFKD